MRKLGLIAGGGALPVSLVRHCLLVGRPVFVIRLRGYADPELTRVDGIDAGIAELGKAISALRRASCETVCLAGKVERPDMAALKPDLRGLSALPRALAAARGGDDSLLTFVLREFETEGFVVEGAHEVMRGLTIGEGPQGAITPRDQDAIDITRALEAARAIGRLDIGQGAVCCGGLVVALEAQEGTDAMLDRVASLPDAVRGGPGRRLGVLAKSSKPGQELRVDLPTVGPETVRRAARAQLAGIAGEVGRLLIVERETTLSLADQAGLFILGLG